MIIKTANLIGSVSRNAGGLFESVRSLVLSLAELGMNVSVFSVTDEFTAEDVTAWEPVRVRTFPAAWPKKFGFSPQYAKELSDFSPDITHSHGIWTYHSVATNHYSHRSGAPYIISPHGMLDPWAVRNSRWKKAIASFFYEGLHLRDAACLRALCASEAHAIRLLGLKNPIAIIPNGIQIPAAGPGYDETTESRSLVGTLKSEGRKVLLYLGRIHPKKGLVNLLKAWAAVATMHSPLRAPRSSGWVLVIAGWDQDRHEAELKQLATELGVVWVDVRDATPQTSPPLMHPISDLRSPISDLRSASLVFLGPQFNEAKSACYRNCDAFVLPSLSEGLPMVVLESWAYGKPVLMTPECNLPEGFTTQAARRIETGVESIGRGLDEMFRAPGSALQAMGDNGRKLVTERFAWPKIAAEMKVVYEWMLGGGPKPGCLAEF